MAVDFKNSETKDNLMRAFAGESQARNRYTIGAEQAAKMGHHVIEQIFLYTANQEKEHAAIFYEHLRALSGENIHIDGSYPVDLAIDVCSLLRMAQHNEYEEHDDVYQSFADKAKEEEFYQVEASFRMIAEVEKVHGDRFGRYAEYMEQNKLYSEDEKTSWFCLNCGYIFEGTQAPPTCPSCHEEGYFIRAAQSPYESECTLKHPQ